MTGLLGSSWLSEVDLVAGAQAFGIFPLILVPSDCQRELFPILNLPGDHKLATLEEGRQLPAGQSVLFGPLVVELQVCDLGARDQAVEVFKLKRGVSVFVDSLHEPIVRLEYFFQQVEVGASSKCHREDGHFQDLIPLGNM